MTTCNQPGWTGRWCCGVGRPAWCRAASRAATPMSTRSSAATAGMIHAWITARSHLSCGGSAGHTRSRLASPHARSLSAGTPGRGESASRGRPVRSADAGGITSDTYPVTARRARRPPEASVIAAVGQLGSRRPDRHLHDRPGHTGAHPVHPRPARHTEVTAAQGRLARLEQACGRDGREPAGTRTQAGTRRRYRRLGLPRSGFRGVAQRPPGRLLPGTSRTYGHPTQVPARRVAAGFIASPSGCQATARDPGLALSGRCDRHDRRWDRIWVLGPMPSSTAQLTAPDARWPGWPW